MQLRLVSVTEVGGVSDIVLWRPNMNKKTAAVHMASLAVLFLTFDLKTTEFESRQQCKKESTLHFAFGQSLTKDHLCEKKCVHAVRPNRQFMAYN